MEIIRYSLNGNHQLLQTTNNTNFSIPNLTPNTLVSDITVSATTGGGEGPTVMVANFLPSDLLSLGQNNSTSGVSGLY